MDSQFMTIAQQSDSLQESVWRVDDGQALHLPIGPGSRALQVLEGRLWLTGRGTMRRPAQDLWLQAGQSAVLPSGSRWVIEGWDSASFQLLVPPGVCRARSQISAGASWQIPKWMRPRFSSMPAD